jgi:superfamily II RNA helicase
VKESGDQAAVASAGRDGPQTLADLLDRHDPTSQEPGRASRADPEDLLEEFAAWAQGSGLPLYPTQEDALLELASGAHVVLATPTGSGKSLVAVGAAYLALASGRRTYYTAPIKALVSEKFFDLCDQFGPDRVGMVTGDAAVNPDAPVVCATAEILANLALREGAGADVGLVVMDEFHYYGDRERGWAWQVPLIELTDAQFLLMSATLGDTTHIRAGLTRRTDGETSTIAGGDRPVPLTFEYVRTPIHATVELLLNQGRAPIYVVHPSQAAALERAQALMSMNLCSKEEKRTIADALGGFRFTAGFGRILSRLIRHGVGVHHAGMLPRYRRLVEQLARSGLLKVICGTDTLGMGINVPIRTVLITSLVKFDGRRLRVLRAREFHQIAGRAGRPGFDEAGWVVVQAPEHDIENAKQLAKAGDDPKKRRKVTRKKPPEGPTWRLDTFNRLTTAEPEPLASRFQVSHAMMLNLAQRSGDTVAAMHHLVTNNDEDSQSQQALLERAEAIRESLVAAGVLEVLTEPDEQGRTLRLVGDLQRDFALDQPLSTFALAAMDLLDSESETYALDVLSILESTLDDPRPVLRAQQSEARGEAIAEMKADGIEYEERMERVEEITWPKPLADLLEGAYEIYSSGHPWVTEYELRPKTVARELSELSSTFVEYVSFHQLATVEGVVLRYLSNAYKALRRTVPPEARTEGLEDLTEWLGEVVRQVDSSLLDEWEQLVHPSDSGEVPDPRESATVPPPVTANPRAFRVLVRNAMFRRVKLARLRHWDELAELDADAGWDAQRWEHAMADYYDEYSDIGIGPPAQLPSLLQIESRPGLWSVRQVLDDPNGDRDWGIHAEVDLAASDAQGSAEIKVTDVGPLFKGW